MNPSNYSSRHISMQRLFFILLIGPIFLFHPAAATNITVQANDTLGSIALRHSVSVNELKRVNKLSSNNLRIGQQLTLPSVAQVKVQSGDTLDGLAKRYDISVQELRNANGGSDKLRIGQIINLRAASNAPTQQNNNPTRNNSKPDNSQKPNGEVVVKEGDTLSEIASRSGVGIFELRRINNLDNNKLRIGQVLKLKATQNTFTENKQIKTMPVTVVRGDTLDGLALKYNTNTDTLRDINNMQNDKLRVGKTFLVPFVNKPVVVAKKPEPVAKKSALVTVSKLVGVANKPVQSKTISPSVKTEIKPAQKPASVKPPEKTLVTEPEIYNLANQISAKEEASKRAFGKTPVKQPASQVSLLPATLPTSLPPTSLPATLPANLPPAQPPATKQAATKPAVKPVVAQAPAKPIAAVSKTKPGMPNVFNTPSAPTAEVSVNNPNGYPAPSNYSTGEAVEATTTRNEVANEVSTVPSNTPENIDASTTEQNLSPLLETSNNNQTPKQGPAEQTTHEESTQVDNPVASPTYTPSEPTNPNSVIPGSGLPPQFTPQKPINPNQYRGERVLWPTSGQITSYFGYRGLRVARSHFHTGLDIAAPYGTTVYAAVSGTVRHSGWSRLGYGYLVVIRSVTGKEYYYGHNSRLLVSRGQFVRQGSAISRVGSTGYSTGPHCHFEIRVGGRARNPLAYLPGSMARQARYVRR